MYRYKSESDKILAEELASKRLFASMLEEDFRDTEKKVEGAQQGGKMLKGKEAKRIISDMRLNAGDDGAFKEWEKATMTEVPVVRKRRYCGVAFRLIPLNTHLLSLSPSVHPVSTSPSHNLHPLTHHLYHISLLPHQWQH